jgi:uncharacterized membrane protein
MPIRISWFAVLLALIIAGLIHIATVLGLPQVAPRNAWTRLSSLAEPNKLVLLPAASPAHQSLPLMAPDMRYAFCRYDVTRGPVRIAAPIIDELWIIAFYRPNGANFYTISGGDINRENIEIIISTENNALLDAETEALYDNDDVVVVTAPENVGLAVIRVPLAGISYAERAEQALRKARCDRVVPDAGLASSRSNMIMSIQRELRARDYDPGPVDGVADLYTRAAIMAYQSDSGLAVTGVASDNLRKEIVLGETAGPIARRSDIPSETTDLIKAVQQFLRDQGYRPGSVDGVAGSGTRRAIRAFERDRGLAQTGRISGKLIRGIVAIAGTNFANATQN